MSDDDFDWNVNTIIWPQSQLAVYTNTRGDLVIRERGDCCEEDHWICVAPTNVRNLVKAILAESGIEALAPASREPTASNAERQRRYRQRHGVTPSNVTQRNGDGALTLVAAE